MAKSTIEKVPLLALRGRVVFPDTAPSFDIGRLVSLNAVRYASDGDTYLFVVAQKDAEKEQIVPDDLYSVGVVCKLRQVTRLPGNTVRIFVEGLFRATAVRVEEVEGCMLADIERLETVHSDDRLEEAYFRTSKDMVHFQKCRVGARTLFRTRPACEYRGALFADKRGAETDASRM